MRILILGSGGREHALAWAINQNPKCNALLCAPGNAGIAKIAKCYSLNIENPATVVNFAKKHRIDFVIIGPEAPLVAGVADALRDGGILTFGPNKAAAQLEASKHFTKEICAQVGAPTAAYAHFTKACSAKTYVQMQGAPIVIKADGLASGKGVTVALDIETAFNAIDAIFAGEFGDARAEIIIEEFMQGEEASLFVLCDGHSVLPIGSAQDHKRVFDGDKGPNTGGMGAYSPAPMLDNITVEKAIKEIIKPTLSVLKDRGTPYQGVLYAGLMINKGQPSLIEYNVRFGDPECQVLMMRLGAQALDLIEATALGTLAERKVNWAEDFALTVVIATKGYPGQYTTGSIINGIDALPETSKSICFHAGTRVTAKGLTATGGRVLNFTARGDNLEDAHRSAYAMLEKLDWPEGFYRKDIGWRALRTVD